MSLSLAEEMGAGGCFFLFVIGSEAKQSREPDSVWINDFVIIRNFLNELSLIKALNFLRSIRKGLRSVATSCHPNFASGKGYISNGMQGIGAISATERFIPDGMKKLSFFACLMFSLGSTNDKQKETSPYPLQRGNWELCLSFFACLMFSLGLSLPSIRG